MMISYYYSNMLVDKLFFIFVCCATLVMLINGQINSDLREASVPDDKTPEKFALELFGIITERVGKANILVATTSVWSLLALLVEGANGETLRQLKNTLGSEADPKRIRQTYKTIQEFTKFHTPSAELYMNQFIFASKNLSILSDYEYILKRDYGTRVDLINLDTKNDRKLHFYYITDYISNVTHGQIDKIFEPRSLTEAELLLVSTLYFRADWMQPFDRSLTKEEPFYDEEENEIGTVNMMRIIAPFPYVYITEIEAYCLELAHGPDIEASMIVFLPRKGVPLNVMIDRLKGIKLQTVYDAIKRATDKLDDDEVEVRLPRFTYTSSITLMGVLKDMGLTDIFTSGDLTKISIDPLHVSTVNQIAKIKVDEGNSKSNVPTHGFIRKIVSPPFIVNRPFTFLIAHKRNNLVLLMGQYIYPKLE